MNIGRFLLDAAELDPGRLAIAQAERELSFEQAARRSGSLAGALAELAGARELRVGVLMWNRPELLESMFAVWQAGGAVVPLNARFVADEVAFHCNDSAARVLIYDAAFDEVVERARPELESVRVFVRVGEPREGIESHDYEQLVAAHEPIAPADKDPGDLAWLFYTSGTTGRPKGAMLSHSNLNFMSVGWLADLTPLRPEDVGLHAAPLSHGAGFHSLALTLKACTQVILPSRSFKPAEFFATVAERRVTNTWLVPTQIRMLLDSEELASADISSLRWIVYGGAPAYRRDLEEAVRRMGPIFVQLFGQGETPMTATYLRPEDHVLEGAHAKRLESCGRPRSGIEIRVEQDGEEVPRGSVGEICVRGPSVMSGYWRREEATAEALRGGWLHTGDVGYQDEHGFVYLLDRSKDLIISGGANVYPREVEEVLLRHPGVAEVCVVGVPHELWGETVLAVVVPAREGLTAEEIMDFASERMAGYKKPRLVEFVEELPKNAYGKVLRRELAARYGGGKVVEQGGGP